MTKQGTITNQEIAKKLVELVGGKENIKAVENCMTRCRLELVDLSKAKIAEIKKAEGTLGVVEAKGQLQVIYGPGKVNKITEEVKKIVGVKIAIGEEAVKATKAKLKEKNDTKFKNILTGDLQYIVLVYNKPPIFGGWREKS